MKTSCLFTCSTVILKEQWDEASVFNFTFTFNVMGLFNCFVLFQDCFLGIIHVTETVWVGYSDSKRDFCRSRQKLRHDKSSIAFSSESAVRERIFDFKGIRAGSISTSLHTIDSKSASRSRNALCPGITNPQS